MEAVAGAVLEHQMIRVEFVISHDDGDDCGLGGDG
jgi:hypothetical protein